MPRTSSRSKKMTDTNTQSATVNTSDLPEKPRYEVEKDLFTWTAQSRPFKKRSREYWVTLFASGALLAFIFFIAEGVMPVILLVSIGFLFYVLSNVNPEQVDYRITTKGIRIADKLTVWDQFTKFWFTKKLDSNTLTFETISFPGRLEVVVLSQDINKIRPILVKYIPEEEPSSTSLDKAADWVSKKLPNQ